jgi:diguanylate cyclase (GGDEF)-like protein
MQLTGVAPTAARDLVDAPSVSAHWATVAIVAALLLIFALDRSTGSAPVQHLYYLPIVFTAIRFGAARGLMAAATAIALSHFANPDSFNMRYEEADILRSSVLIAAALIAARLADDKRRLRRLAMTDDLTGLHNLRSFEEGLRIMVREAREARTPLALLVLDLDRLKSLNDVHGHLAGAEAVRTLGQILAVRLPPSAAPCRYGGDEFVVALPGLGELEAVAVAEDLRRAIGDAAPVLAGAEFPAGTLTISIGVACWDPARDAHVTVDAAGEALFRAADRALYAAKNDGRNRVHADSTWPQQVMGSTHVARQRVE